MKISVPQNTTTLTPKEELQNWEENTQNQRLKARHIILNKKANSQKTKTEKQTLETQQHLKESIKKWNYLPATEDNTIKPPNTEIAWMIISQIAWKGTDIEEEELFEDLPETDPMQIINLEKRGPEELSLIPDEKVLLLHNILNELELHGVKIKDKIFSTNWERKGKRHKRTGSSRFKEITEKEEMPKITNPLFKKEKIIKEIKPKKTGKKKAKKTSLLSAFFGILG